MAAIIAIDIGNQHINLGVFEEKDLRVSLQITTRVQATPDEYGVLLRSLLRQRGWTQRIEGGILASSVPPMVPTFLTLCKQEFDISPLVVAPGIKTGVKIRTDNPREVGGDRIANALAAKTLYGAPSLVIDFSPITIFDAVNAGGEYVGSAITPGMVISADALFRTAAQLLRVELAPPESRTVIGKNSIDAVRAGLLYGYVSLVEGMVTRFKQELGEKTQVIATGEQIELVAQETSVIDTVDEHLTLKGLSLIYELNTQGNKKPPRSV